MSPATEMKPTFFDPDDPSGEDESGDTRRPPRSLLEWFKRHPEWTQAELAKKVGLRPPTISLLVSGQRAVRLKYAERLARVTGLPEKIFQVLPKRRKRGPPKR